MNQAHSFFDLSLSRVLKGKSPIALGTVPLSGVCPSWITSYRCTLFVLSRPFEQASLKTSFSQGISKLLLFIGNIFRGYTVRNNYISKQFNIFESSLLSELSKLSFTKVYSAWQSMVSFLLHCHEVSK